MTTWTTLAIGLGGGAGAIARVVADAAISARVSSPFPFGTLAVNVSGAFLLGLLTGLAPGTTTTLIVGTGAIGGYTTFSTWMFETQRLAEDGWMRLAAINIVGSVALGSAAIVLGRALTG